MENVVIVGAVRTPIGDHLGSLSSLSAVELGTLASAEVLRRAKVDPSLVDEVTAGMVYKAGVKGNPARQIQLAVHIPVKAPAMTVDQQCASAMRAFEIAADKIALGKTEVALAVGTESMSQVPHLIMGLRGGVRIGAPEVCDSLLYDALTDAFTGEHMGVTAENVAEKYKISRQEQDELAVLSHRRAVAAQDEGRFDGEIVPVEVKTRKGPVVVCKDEHPRRDASLETLAKLRPAFRPNGTVTAGNASGINDGAAALLLMSESAAKRHGIAPLAKVLNIASVGVEPEIMGMGPCYAIPEALKGTPLALSDIEYFEINEAFAAQFLAVSRELGLDMEKVNANGSGIALGHPVGCTGIRIIVTMLHEMRRRRNRYGVSSLCVGGGPAMAAVFEMC